jgi:hypothetical protein
VHLHAGFDFGGMIGLVPRVFKTAADGVGVDSLWSLLRQID